MRFSVASAMLLVLAALLLAIRGAADWSQSFAVAWYGVFGTAAILSVAAVAAAVGSRQLSAGRRATIILLALPALVAVPMLIALVRTLAPLAD
jgi:hypothetical protein